MKHMTIRQVLNGWIVNVGDNMIYQYGTAANDSATQVFQNISQLQEALPGLLSDGKCEADPMYTVRLTSEQCLESHKKAVEEFEAKSRQQIVTEKLAPFFPQNDPTTGT